jgi:hypothetical protein
MLSLWRKALMANPLQQAVESAERSNDVIGRSFARVGTADHPNGFVVSAYRDANEALALALAEGNEDRLRRAMAITRSLRAEVTEGVRREIVEMIAFGEEEANRQLRFYNEAGGSVDPLNLSEEINAAVSAIDEKIISQEAVIRSMVLTDAEAELITGREGRVGVLRASDVTALAAVFIASFVWDGFLYVVDNFNLSGRRVFQKQAVAALDHRTTETCLLVHGQIKGFNDKFHLTGEPRYADLMDFPAFHPWCRTSVALYDASFEDGITQQMLNGAQTILNERTAGGSGFRNPANAFA